MPRAMAKWLLVDGYNMAFRAFYGMPELTRTDGFPTGALHGWVKTMWRLQDQEKPDAMVVFFDLGARRTGWPCTRNTRRNARRRPSRWKSRSR